MEQLGTETKYTNDLSLHASIQNVLQYIEENK